jgi:hypothetical protein
VFMARRNMLRQIAAAAREAWLRDFRQAMTAIVSSYPALEARANSEAAGDPEALRAAEERLHATLDPAYSAIRFLIAERGEEYNALDPVIRQFVATPSEAQGQALTRAGADIVRRERDAIARDPTPWRPLRDRPGWRDRPPWPQLRSWLGRDPPRFRDLP